MNDDWYGTARCLFASGSYQVRIELLAGCAAGPPDLL